MRLVVVDRLVYRLARAECLDVIDQKIDVESIRMIEVDVVAQLDRHIAQVAIIGILLQVDYTRWADRLNYPVSDCGFPGPRSSGYPDQHKLFTRRLVPGGQASHARAVSG